MKYWFALFLLAAAMQALMSTDNVDPCVDYAPVTDSSSQLKWWKREDVVPQLYRGDGITFQWSWVKRLPVKGSNVSVEDVLALMDTLHCSFIAWADVAWKTLQRVRPHSIEGEVECALPQLVEECNAVHFNLCSLRKVDGITFMHIGAPRRSNGEGPMMVEMNVYARGSRYDLPLFQLPFSVHALAVRDDMAGDIVLVELVRGGVHDACTRRIRPSVSPNMWYIWIAHPPNKIFSYFDLRAQQFSPADSGLRSWISENIVNGTIEMSKEDILQWYCGRARVEGILVRQRNDVFCYIHESLSHLSSQAEEAREALQSDIPMAWQGVFNDSLHNLQLAYVGDQKFDELLAANSKAATLKMQDRASTRGAVNEKVRVDGRALPTDGASSTETSSPSQEERQAAAAHVSRPHTLRNGQNGSNSERISVGRDCSTSQLSVFTIVSVIILSLSY